MAERIILGKTGTCHVPDRCYHGDRFQLMMIASSNPEVLQLNSDSTSRAEVSAMTHLLLHFWVFVEKMTCI